MTTGYFIDLVGTSVFAISGALSALSKKMYHDLFGIFFIGFLTATGGGTLRDVVMGAYPIAWIRDPNYLIVIMGSVGVAVLGRRWWLGKLRNALLFFDTLGIGIYTIFGMQKALSLDVNHWAAILLGMISALFGGVLRDTLVNDLPLIFDRQIYATACLAGAIIYLIGHTLELDPTLNFLLSAGSITLIRLLAIRKGWSLPRIDNQ
ncbi:trimeric intracellular cation channel family protein [Larkinella humicola]|uniref:Trimeric intracellular cation channel family protein n=1 Tax=Larkinella humicola TaxID=2607654 RepID=A0A5N1JJA2_9BACT|nr:trimeric intracellular cation channel family protein [Larkinella humicola]KAA9356224.1 trimeric intracellular cation channel family protein [Larkinella humicola]